MFFEMVQGGSHGLFEGGKFLKAGPSQGKLSVAAENAFFPRAFPSSGVTGLGAAFHQDVLLHQGQLFTAGKQSSPCRAG